MKTMYMLRPTDGRVMRYNGVWTEMGFLQGLAPARLGARMATTWFKFAGKLWCAVLAERNVFVGTVDNGNITPVATQPTMVQTAVWGNTINFAGKIRWLERNENGVLLYSFNGTTITVLPVDMPATDQPIDQLMDELTLELVGTRLAVLPRACVAFASAQPQVKVRNVVCFLDLSDDRVVVTTAASLEPAVLNTVVPKTEADAGTHLSETIVGAGVYQDNVIALYADGVLGRVTGDARVKIADVRIEGFMRQARYATIADGSPTRQVIIDIKQLQKDVLPYLLGARIFISGGKFAGQSGTVVWIEGNNQLQLRIASDDPNPFPVIAAHVEVSFGRGVAGGFVSEPVQRSVPGPLVHTAFFPVADALYGVVLGRQPSGLAVDNRCQPSFLVRLRGNAAVFSPLQVNGAWLNVNSMVARFDITDSSIHILAYDAQAALVRHFRFSLSSGMLSELAAAFAAPTATHLAAGNLIGFDAGELDISIGSIESDSTTGDVTVAYTIFGDTPENHAIDMFYNTGDGWRAASISPRAGPPFTFVHALRTDLPSFAGDIQYRAHVRRP